MKEKINFGMGDAAGSVFSAMVAMYLTAYYTDTMGMAAAAIGTMMLISRVFDGITDLIMGAIVDKTKSKYGKARPWILWTAPFMALAMIAMFNMPASLSQGGKLFYAYLSYIVANCLVFTAMNVPYNALLSRMTLDVNDRGSATAIRFVMAQLVTMIVNSITAFTIQTIGFAKLSIIYGVIMAIMQVLCFIGTREHIDAAEEEKRTKQVPLKESLGALGKNPYFFLEIAIFIVFYIGSVPNAMMGFYYCRVVLNAVQLMAIMSVATTLPNIIMNFFTGSLYARFGKRKIMLVGCVMFAGGGLIVMLGGDNIAIIMTGVIIRAFSMGIMMSGIFATAADVVDYGEWKTGIRSEGIINSGASFGMKVGIGLGGAVGAWLLALGKYDGTAAVQADSAVKAIRFGFGDISIYVGIALFIMIFLSRLDKRLPEIQTELESRHTQA